jgi:hypothetical protein
MKGPRRRGDVSYSFYLGIKWMVSVTPRLLFEHGKRTPKYPLDWKLGGLLSWSAHIG